MKSYKDFFDSLGAEFFHELESELHSNQFVLNAPTEEMKRHCEISVISSIILGKYHEWLSEQLSQDTHRRLSE